MRLQARTWLDQIRPYQPGRRAPSDAGSMAANESVLQASDGVVAAVAAAARWSHRYPDPLADDLRRELAALHGVGAEKILVGNGSDELIFLLAGAYLAGNGVAICADPPYRVDEISTYVVGARVSAVPLVDFAHDLDAMARLDADIAYLVNPHNPTGTTRSRADIATFVATSPAGLIVVDEAYIDFADDPAAMTAIPLVASGRVAVLRTFSKAYGLAGLRVGYLVADETVIATLRKIRAPFSVGVLAQAAALAALVDGPRLHQVRALTTAHRRLVQDLFCQAGYQVVPSQANFVLVLTDDETSLVDHLADHGIAVRPGSSLGTPGAVRVTVPTADGLELLRLALVAPVPLILR